MATESPIRIIEAGGKWASRNDMKSFWKPSTNMGIEDLGLILHGQILKGQKSNLPPNRSGSAPPSIEGSFAAIENLMFTKEFNATDSNISEAEEQVRADPLTPRLPPPSISGENRNLFWNVRGTGNNRRLSSFDDTLNSLLWLDHCNLSTHKEESDDDRSPKQEDLSEAQSPASTQSRLFGHETNDESNPTSTNVSNSSSIDGIRGNMAIESPVNKSLNDHSKDDVSISSAADGDVAAIRNEIASLSVSNFPKLDSGINQIDWQQRNPSQVHATRPQIVSLPQTYVGMNQFLQNPINFSSEVQPTPHYASGSHLYSNMMPTGYFPQQYTIGGYPFNPPHVSPYATAYPLNNLFPTPFSNAFSGQSQTPGVNLEHFNNFYGHVGVPFLGEQNLQSLGALSHINLNSRRVGTTSPYYFGNPTNVDFSQFPTSPFASPVIRESPMSGSSHRGRRTEGVYGGWKGNSGNHVINDPKMFSFLEELKSGKGRTLELSDIYGHIVEFSVDQHGSRFIQQKLEVCTNEEKESVFKEVIPHASRLITDVFGNYVIQKFFEYGSVEQRRELGNQLEGQILPLSFQMYGCRVIQKAFDTIELEQRTKLVRELDGHVLKCVRDQNGNHVIQKCIESIPTENIIFVISSFHGQVAALSKHPYGCRVIQRVLERCTDELHNQFIVNEILDSVFDLAQDQYGNYVTQYVLEGGKPEERSQIVQKLAGHIVQLSQHKFASNVIEKCLEHCDSASREMMIEEIMGYADGNDNLMVMVKDQFANYVVQRVLQTCSGQQREILLDRIKSHLDSLKKYTYGKHIVARFEQLYGEEIETSGS